ncbi:hypothetical protein CAPTEDRAFT_187812 [Capitella teleta]|uniref:DDE Tnp4 domain-containing protein n=1 Tax=Capitella teleta TaxID=283909 RepID=R7VI65_CAPTE|nr:hypothetical protein CAPTEDRAFT_187812 [Capitella teleta]|eukprot:ELU18299.1 hypothetical protein CAPTEDRAFT_187812 [Capitella teleta]
MSQFWAQLHSKRWAGRTSNKHTTENSGFLKYLLNGDVVLADRGFKVEEAIGLQGARLEIPVFTKGKAQMDKRSLSQRSVEETRKLVRIHVERVIGNVRQKYKIPQGPVEMPFTSADETEIVIVFDKMAQVACGLTNLRSSIVSAD